MCKLRLRYSNTFSVLGTYPIPKGLLVLERITFIASLVSFSFKGPVARMPTPPFDFRRQNIMSKAFVFETIAQKKYDDGSANDAQGTLLKGLTSVGYGGY